MKIDVMVVGLVFGCGFENYLDGRPGETPKEAKSRDSRWNRLLQWLL